MNRYGYAGPARDLVRLGFKWRITVAAPGTQRPSGQPTNLAARSGGGQGVCVCCVYSHTPLKCAPNLLQGSFRCCTTPVPSPLIHLGLKAANGLQGYLLSTDGRVWPDAANSFQRERTGLAA